MPEQPRAARAAPDPIADPLRPAPAETALRRVATAARTVLAADRASAYLLDAAGRVIERIATTEHDPRVRGLLLRAAGRPAAGLALSGDLLAGRTITIHDATADPRIPPALARALRTGALLAMPLAADPADGPPLGAVVWTFHRPRELAPADIAAAASVRDLASLALNAVRAKADAKRRLRLARQLEAEQSALRRVATEAAVSAGTTTTVHAAAAEEAARLMGVDAALVVRFDPEGALVVGAAGEPLAPGDRLPIVGDGVIARVAISGQPAAVAPYVALPERSEARSIAARLGFRAAAAAPVHVEGRLWGAIVATARDARSMPADATARLGRFASLVAVALANAEARADLIARSTRDPLTALANHRAWFDALDRETRRARRLGRPLAVVVMDLDHFKAINDRHGHLIGDQVLVEFAGRLADHARSRDTVGRIGGEEFAWLIPDCGPDEALRAAERMRTAVENRPFADVGPITMSTGTAILGPDSTARTVFAAADAALYRAKAAGRNRSHIAPGP